MKGLAVALILIAWAGGSCSSGHAPPTPASAPPPSATFAPTMPSPEPIPSPTRAPAVSGGGWLVYIRAGDLYVGALDGSHEQQLTSGMTSLGFAGYARDDENTTWAYFASLAERRSDGGALVSVGRQALGGTATDALFTFQANVQEVATSNPIATVSPDGRYIAYTDERGLRLYDVAAHSDRSLLSNQPQSPANTPGNIYLSPLWAPAGGWLVVTRTGYPPYDKPFLDFIRPLDPVTEYTADVGGAFRAWSPDGSTLCASRAGRFDNGYTFDDVGLVTPRGGEFQILMHHVTVDKPGYVPTVIDPTACSWSRDGRVAISYGIERTNDSAISVLSSAGESLSQLRISGTFSVAGWLGNGNGVLRGVEDPRLGNQNVVLMLDASVRSVPFSPERILSVIPAP